MTSGLVSRVIAQRYDLMVIMKLSPCEVCLLTIE